MSYCCIPIIADVTRDPYANKDFMTTMIRMKGFTMLESQAEPETWMYRVN